jgi:hypothetical protein
VKERAFQARVFKQDDLRGAEAPLFHGNPYVMLAKNHKSFSPGCLIFLTKRITSFRVGS